MSGMEDGISLDSVLPARAYILLSDILRKQGNEFEANEYLKSLKENYPGQEADIFQMIDQRLK